MSTDDERDDTTGEPAEQQKTEAPASAAGAAASAAVSASPGDEQPHGQPFTAGDPKLDAALTDMALALRQLVQTLKSSKIEDERLDRCNDQLSALLKGVPNA